MFVSLFPGYPAIFAIVIFLLLYVIALILTRNPCWWFYIVGCALNLVVVAANGGYMPVLGRLEAQRIWIPLTPETNLPFLADIFFLPWGMSLGDIFIFTGVIGMVIRGAISILKGV